MLSKSSKYDIVKRSHSLHERRDKPRTARYKQATIVPLSLEDSTVSFATCNLEGSYRRLCVSPISWSTATTSINATASNSGSSAAHRLTSPTNADVDFRMFNASTTQTTKITNNGINEFCELQSVLQHRSKSPPPPTSQQSALRKQYEENHLHQQQANTSLQLQKFCLSTTAGAARFPRSCLVTKLREKDKLPDSVAVVSSENFIMQRRQPQTASQQSSQTLVGRSPSPKSLKYLSTSAALQQSFKQTPSSSPQRIAIPRQLFDSLPESSIDPDGGNSNINTRPTKNANTSEITSSTVLIGNSVDASHNTNRFHTNACESSSTKQQQSAASLDVQPSVARTVSSYQSQSQYHTVSNEQSKSTCFNHSLTPSLDSSFR